MGEDLGASYGLDVVVLGVFVVLLLIFDDNVVIIISLHLRIQ